MITTILDLYDVLSGKRYRRLMAKLNTLETRIALQEAAYRPIQLDATRPTLRMRVSKRRWKGGE